MDDGPKGGSGNRWDNTVAESLFSSLKKERIKKRTDKTVIIWQSDAWSDSDQFETVKGSLNS